VIGNFNADGFSSLYPRYRGGRPPKFTLAQRRDIKKIAKSRPVDHDLPFPTWSLAKLADFLVAEGVVDDISHEGLRALLREEGVIDADGSPLDDADQSRCLILVPDGPREVAGIARSLCLARPGVRERDSPVTPAGQAEWLRELDRHSGPG
jgi:hypothetical protein